jgi:hypothetical protein
VKDILLQAVEVDLPGDDSSARGSTPEGGKLIGSPNDGEAVVQPIGVRQSHRSGPACGLGALDRLRHVSILTNGWRRCRHIKGARSRNAGATVRIVCRRGFVRTPFAICWSRGCASSRLGGQPCKQGVGSRCSVDGHARHATALR